MEDCEVRIAVQAATTEDYVILTDYGSTGPAPETEASHDVRGTRGARETQNVQVSYGAQGTAGFALAIDIGTTTVVGKLIDLSTGLEVASFAELNAQIPYGADVISRIEAAFDDAQTLSGLITRQLDRAITTLLAERGIKSGDVQKLVIAGNTAMSYILLGIPCRSLGLAPFKPAFTIGGPYPYQDIFHTDTLNCACDVLPFISAYVGGDLTAGLCALRGEDDFILMDMGTNGELLFKRGERLICTATAAGPAFEGGAIECGSGSVRGAISSVNFEGGSLSYRTIGAAPATSICGSGILDLMAGLITEGFVDATGLLSSSFEDGRVVLAPDSTDGQAPAVFFTQADIRQVQLAKSAIRAGLEVIQSEMGGPPPSRIFLAGGFGQNLNPQSAQTCGLLPRTFEGRLSSIGNSSLSGAAKLCLNSAIRAEVTARGAQAQEINLATHPLFSDLFMEHMLF
jgi:uncharacterized 2Fe-2S/4Fe-4S cluster protein (DUF4445 family)